jgi:hypothetical protein
MSNTQNQNGGIGYPPFLIPRTVNPMTNPITSPMTNPITNPITSPMTSPMMNPLAPTRINMYNPITGRVGPSFTNFAQEPMEQYVSEDYNNGDCKVTISGSKKSVDDVKRILNAYFAVKHRENPYTSIGDQTVELDSNIVSHVTPTQNGGLISRK